LLFEEEESGKWHTTYIYIIAKNPLEALEASMDLVHQLSSDNEWYLLDATIVDMIDLRN
jgi:hypothetical protein